MQAVVYNLAGDEVEKIELDETIFGITPNMALIHQAVLRQQANGRQGTHETKTRAFVSGGGRKPWRQKGTGRARQGSTRSPQWRHGGVAFGPHVRSYEQDMPRKMRRLAIRGVLSSKAAEGRIVLVDSFAELEPRTKAMIEIIKKLNIGDSTALIMTSGSEESLEKAAANLPRVHTMPAHLLSVVDMLKHNYIIMPRASLELVTGILGNTGGRAKYKLAGSTATNGSSNGNGSSETETQDTEPAASATATATATRTATRKKAAASESIVASADPSEEPATDVRFAPSDTQQETAEATLSDDTETGGTR